MRVTAEKLWKHIILTQYKHRDVGTDVTKSSNETECCVHVDVHWKRSDDETNGPAN